MEGDYKLLLVPLPPAPPLKDEKIKTLNRAVLPHSMPAIAKFMRNIE